MTDIARRRCALKVGYAHFSQIWQKTDLSAAVSDISSSEDEQDEKPPSKKQVKEVRDDAVRSLAVHLRNVDA